MIFIVLPPKSEKLDFKLKKFQSIGVPAFAFVLLLVASDTSNNPALGAAQSANSSINGFNLIAVGDWGCNPNTINTVKNIVAKNPELVLGLGDYSYRTSADCWLKIVDSLDHKMKIAIADHDAVSSSLLNQYLKHFNLTQQYYSFNYQNMHFTVLSEEVPNEADSEQYKFINDDLAAASSNSSIDWIIVMNHEPMYTSPYKEWNGMDLSLIEAYQPVFDKYKVDLVLSGDIHNYQRSFPLRYDPLRHYDTSNPANAITAGPVITTVDKSNYIHPTGQIYITVGTGGAPLQTSLKGQSKFIAIQDATVHGILDIEIIDNGQRLVGTFYANEDWVIKDRFSIDKRTDIPRTNVSG
jgi:predicted MPP superfamily phosphohydrolase